MPSLLLASLLIAAAALLSWPLGRYLAAVMDPASDRRPRGLHALLDAFFARFGGQSSAPTSWSRYVLGMLLFNALMFAVAAAFLALQSRLPLNPDARGPLSWDLIFNIAASFATNTNLQHYSGEVSLSYFSQLFALMWLQFVSAATGLACLVALARGLAGRTDFGGFLVDLQRAAFLVLLPLAALVSVFYLLGGMPMTFEGAALAATLEGATQTIARGPVAAFVAIKQIGTNGGGFFGPNSTHPFENPGALTNLVSLFAIVALPMACVWMFGRVTGKMRHAAVVFGVMLALLAGKTAWALHFESAPPAAFAGLPAVAPAANLEGKELRLGATTGPLWAVFTTATSNGSVGAMHNSLNPLTGLAPLTGMWLNETFGGVGVGLINQFIYIVVAVFLGGMLIGRTPEHLGKRVESREMLFASITLLAHPLLVLGGTALFAANPWGFETIKNAGPRGFTEILYEFSSAAANNGSGCEGLGDGTVAWNVATGLVMLVGRYLPIILPLAIAGSIAARRPVAETSGTLRTDTPTFGVLLLGVIVLFGALTFLPAALLGPIAEHLLLVAR